MPSRFEMREVGTGRLLGTMEMVDVLQPGGVVQMFRAGLVQVEDPAPPAPAASAPPASSAPRHNPGRRKGSA